MVLTAGLAFVVVATAAVSVAHSIARSNALAEAQRSARSIAETIVAPVLPAAMQGDPVEVGRLRRMVEARSRDGSLVRIKVWNGEEEVVFSDFPPLIGRAFPRNDDIRAVLDTQQSRADLSNLTDAENVDEALQFDRLVEVYTPMTASDGQRYVFEAYSSDRQVRTAERQLTAELVPFALGSLLVLLIAQLPLSMWLVRRVARAQQERSRLLRSSLVASARERRDIARDLHDGVVQDLAGASYALGTLTLAREGAPDSATRTMLGRISTAVLDAVNKLRTLMIDIYPPDLTADGLGTAVGQLAGPLRADGVEVDIEVDLRVEPAPDVAATLYRCAREGLANVRAHAQAHVVRVVIEGDSKTMTLTVADDGCGLGSVASLDRRSEGHFGLALLRDSATDLGGELTLTSTPGGGTTLMMRLPSDGVLIR